MNRNNLIHRIAIVGAGAVGGFVGARLASAGLDVTLIDPWEEHVSFIQREGLFVQEAQTTLHVRPSVLHPNHLGQLGSASSFDLAIICVKLHHTAWAVDLIAPYLNATGCIVTLQNSLIEELVARKVGWDRTVGCIASGMYVSLDSPGHIKRSRIQGQVKPVVFYVGEVNGQQTTRIEQIAALFSHAEKTAITHDLFGLRWTKLVANSMTSGLSAVHGLGLKATFGSSVCRQEMLQLACEAINVGQKKGFILGDIFGLSPCHWLGAGNGDQDALRLTDAAFQRQHDFVDEHAISGTRQDLLKKRPTEVEYMNGFVALKAKESNVSALQHEKIAKLIRQMEKQVRQ